MATLKAFTKIKDIREREKNERQVDYQSAMAVFEQVATTLYTLLKQKEEAMALFEAEQRKKTVKASSFLQHQRYIDSLEKQIESLQPKVQKAREAMNARQVELTDAYVEMKKFEKVIDRKLEVEKQLRKEDEFRQMDDLSMKQYLNFQNR